MIYTPPPYDQINFDSLGVIYTPLPYDAVDFDPTVDDGGFQFPWNYLFAVIPQ